MYTRARTRGAVVSSTLRPSADTATFSTLTFVRSSSGDVRWWTWAGYRANATLASTLDGLTDPAQNHEDNHLRLRKDLTPTEWKAGAADAAERICLPHIDEKALAGLKFSSALPSRLATATLAARLADIDGAVATLTEPTSFTIE